MNNVYVLGSINMDMVISTPYMPAQGETLLGSDFFLNGGGKGANQAVASAKQGALTYLIGNVGNDVFGNDLVDKLAKYGVNISFIKKLDGVSTGVASIIICDRDNRIILDSGANAKISLNQIDEALENAKENDVFVTQLENNLDAVIYGLKKAKEKKMITVFNPAPAKKLDQDVFSYVDYLIINETECEIFSNILPHNVEDIVKAKDIIKASNLIVTLGSKGSILVDKNGKVLNIKPNKIDAIDTTAAGDTFVGVFASRAVNELYLEDALSYVSIASSLTCLKKGAQQSIPTREEVEKYIEGKM